MLLNYILNEIEARENYYGDMLSPFKRNLNVASHDNDSELPLNTDDHLRVVVIFL